MTLNVGSRNIVVKLGRGVSALISYNNTLLKYLKSSSNALKINS